MDERRLLIECREMRRTPLSRRFELYEDTSRRTSDWSRYRWRGWMPSGHSIEARYASGHPSYPMKVFVSPKLRTHHYWPDGSLCLMKPSQWSPNFTAATIIGIVARFLDDYARGKAK